MIADKSIIGSGRLSGDEKLVGRWVRVRFSIFCFLLFSVIFDSAFLHVQSKEPTMTSTTGVPVAFHHLLSQTKQKEDSDAYHQPSTNGLHKTRTVLSVRRPYSFLSGMRMAPNGPGFRSGYGFGDASWDANRKRRSNGRKNNNKKGKKILQRYGGNSTGFSSTATSSPSPSRSSSSSQLELELLKRITQLEHLVATQSVEITRLKQQCEDLTDTAAAFSNVIELLKEAGLTTDHDASTSKENEAPNDESNLSESNDNAYDNGNESSTVESFNDAEIFGTAPSSVVDAADSAGASILAAVLGGKQRMLVDVRDAELTRDTEALVQFIELAILPVAAGLEGLKGARNRVKIVFPTVCQLLEHRRAMALAAPEVVALSTLGFGPVEDNDAIVVILAPSPDNEEGLKAMNDLLDPSTAPQFSQPVVVLNHHMVPISGPAKFFDIVYQLRLFSVQFMSGDNPPEYFKQLEEEKMNIEKTGIEKEVHLSNTTNSDNGNGDDELEAAMKHAHEAGLNMGITRAMIIRAYPKPWHVFVDTSPDTDADFVIAGSFDEDPSQDDVNFAIVECLEGSEREDAIVAQQMQQALESGQLDNIMRFNTSVTDARDSNDKDYDDDNREEDDDYFNDFRIYPEDSV